MCGADNFGSKAERARSERTDMLKRKNPSRMEAGMRNAAKIRPARGKRLKKAAQGAVLAAAHLMAEAGEAPVKLFSSGAVDRMVAPMTRFHV